MLSYNELKPGTFIIWEGVPWEVLEFEFSRMQQRKPVAKTKLKNLETGTVQEKTFHQSDKLEEADIEKEEIKFLYNHRDEYWFVDKDDPSKRFKLSQDQIDKDSLLAPNMLVTSLKFNDKIVGIDLPIKAEYKVIEAEPAIKGNTAQGGNKTVVIEGGKKIQTPMFINEGDIIRINTETGQYVERVTNNK